LIETWSYDWAYQSKELTFFCGDPVPVRLPDHFSISLIHQWILDLLAPADFKAACFGEMSDADKRMNPLHFGSDLADSQIRIRINPDIKIRIPDHFCLRFCHWQRSALSEHSLVIAFMKTRTENNYKIIFNEINKKLSKISELKV